MPLACLDTMTKLTMITGQFNPLISADSLLMCCSLQLGFIKDPRQCFPLK